MLSIHKKNKFSYRLMVIDKACQSDNVSSLPTLPCRPIMRSILIIAPVDWTANSPIVLACNFTAYFISHLRLLFQSGSPKVHLLSLRQLSHDKFRSWLCVFCCEWAKRSINRSEISVFKQHVSPAYDLNNVRFLNGIHTTFL